MTKINCELPDLMKRVLIRSEELKQVISEQENLIANLSQIIEEQKQYILNSNQRLDQLEVSTTQLEEEFEVQVSFSAVTLSDRTLNTNPVVFDDVRHNIGLGYDGSTGKYSA